MCQNVGKPMRVGNEVLTLESIEFKGGFLREGRIVCEFAVTDRGLGNNGPAPIGPRPLPPPAPPRHCAK